MGLTTTGEMRYCIVHNPLLLQPLGHWFTFISRKYEHLAVGSWGWRSYRLSWVFPFGTASPSPFVPLLYHNFGNLSRGFLHFFSRKVRATFLRRGRYPVATSPLDFSYIVSHIGRFVKRVFEKNRNFFSKGCSLHSMGMVATHRLFGFVSQRGRLSLSGALPS
jgi:hypothetical protein